MFFSKTCGFSWASVHLGLVPHNWQHLSMHISCEKSLFFSPRPFSRQLYGRGSSALSRHWILTGADGKQADWQIVRQIGTCLQSICWAAVKVFSPREGKGREGKEGPPHSFNLQKELQKNPHTIPHKSIQDLIFKINVLPYLQPGVPLWWPVAKQPNNLLYTQRGWAPNQYHQEFQGSRRDKRTQQSIILS